MADYVNATADEGMNSLEKRENYQSGRSKVFLVVGVSFGLLCIIQSALNVALRLQGIGFCNNSDLIYSTNITMMSALLQEKDQLAKELQVDNNNLTSKIEVLNDKLREYDNSIKKLITEKETLMNEQTEVSNLRSCPKGWCQYMSGCYRLSTVKKTWWQAKDNCKKKGAHLVILNDSNEEIILFIGSA